MGAGGRRGWVFCVGHLSTVPRSCWVSQCSGASSDKVPVSDVKGSIVRHSDQATEDFDYG